MLNQKTLGAIIKQKRKEAGMTQDQLSTATNLSRNYISDIENGRYTPSLNALSKIAICLDIDLNVLKMTEIQDITVNNDRSSA
ncbi:helix-turn-helix domain-containing protein [Geobacillus thermodenitrificans]|jgi:transcriptional regulator with XRE-family HTH domain|uniref:Helix-turn-helix transcriptional regulator n=1 Tax=Geobacillus thermodenitrificans TaxID=33940 RepID=A0ABY9Q8U7_GEOTD|nr:helix-turn-helix transcriptional regulator [Geobacillus thermodenitrificans]ARA99098.1 transcriptional regulator [Geobacillus thermodenitrificans]MED3716073.1 helix-turn-helix transcriptional regulator [Geobacillus thermodenitrificans]WMV75340.1 helix-turn-helix transcriptional regulator [Geobacillus thermodenitrificans]